MRCSINIGQNAKQSNLLVLRFLFIISFKVSSLASLFHAQKKENDGFFYDKLNIF